MNDPSVGEPAEGSLPYYQNQFAKQESGDRSTALFVSWYLSHIYYPLCFEYDVVQASSPRQKYVKIPTITPRTSSKSVVRHDWNISMTKQFQQRMSRFLQRWRTQRNAIRNANCTISESSKLWTQLALPCGVCLLECLWIPHTLSSCHGSTSRRTFELAASSEAC